MSRLISRRTMLRGTGASICLPLLGSLHAQGTVGGKPPKRLIFLNFGYGPSKSWYPEDAGADFTLPACMKPLARHRERFSPISNLSNLASAVTGAHWGSTTFLTGTNVRRTPGREFHNGLSCDQLAARHMGKGVRFSSLVLGGQDSAGSGPGASLSWDAQGNSIQGESDLVALYNQLFGDGGMSVAQRRELLTREHSVLDAVRLDAKHLRRQAASPDREKVDEYFGLIRSIETRLNRSNDWLDVPKPRAPFKAPAKTPTGTPGIELTFDLMTAALQTDSTRVITYRMPTGSLLREFGQENNLNPVGAHNMTHFGPKTSVAYKQLTWRDHKLCSLYASLLDRLQAVKEADGTTLLDNTLVVMGSGLRTGHTRRNVPILLAGGGKGLRHGTHYVYKKSEGRLGNLWASMLNYAGCPVESFADSDGLLTDIFA